MATDHNFKVKNGLTVQGETLVVNHTGDVDGTQVYIKKKDSSTNLMRWGEGTSGVTTYKWRMDQFYDFIGNNGSDVIVLKSSDGSIQGQSYKIGSTTIIDSSRNLTNIPSIRLTNEGDAALTSTSHAFQVGPTSGYNLIIDSNEVMARNNGSASTLYIQNDGGTVHIGANVSTNLQVDGNIKGVTGNTTGKFAVKSTAVHNSYDFYNDGTTYLNGTTEVNAEFKISSSSSYITHFNYQDGGTNIISQANGGSTSIRNNNGNLFTLSSTGSLSVAQNVIAGSSSSAAIVRAHYNDGSYMSLEGFGLVMNRDASYIRPSTNNDKTLYVGGADASLNWASVRFRSGGGLYLSGSQFIDASRNLTNIGTISSGAITSSGNLVFSGNSRSITMVGGDTNSQPSIAIGEQNLYGYRQRWDSGQKVIFEGWWASSTSGAVNRDFGHLDLNSKKWRFNDYVGINVDANTTYRLYVNGNIRADGNYYVGGLTVIDSSRNLTNIGTISSGAITSSGVVNAATHFNVNGSGNLLKVDVSAWDSTGNNDQAILWNGYNSTIGDHIVLKAAGNGTAHGAIVIADNVFSYGRTTSAISTSASLTNPLSNSTAFTVTSGGNAEFAGDVKADTHFTSSDSNATLSSSGSGGNVYLRPNGKGSETGQVRVDTTGKVSVSASTSTSSSSSLKLHVGTINSTGSSAIAQFGGFIRAADYYILHASTGSTDSLFIDYVGDDMDITAGEGTYSGVLRANGYKVGTTTVIGTGRLVQNVDLKAGNSGARLKNDNWFYDTAAKERIYFHSSNNYYKTASTSGSHIWRVSGDTQVMSLNSGGDLTIPGDFQAENATFTGTGDVTVKIIADTDNSIEADNPTLGFSQDGNTAGTMFVIGLEGNENTAFPGSKVNSPYIHANVNSANHPLSIANNGSLVAQFNSTSSHAALTVTKFSNITGTDGSTILNLKNYMGSSTTTGDLSQQKSFIDFQLLDSNGNEVPQVRIGAEVGEGGDANSQTLEGSGAFVVYTNDADTTSGDAGASLTEKFRVAHDGTSTFTNNVVIGGNLTVNGTQTTLNTATLQVEDKNIVLNYGTGDTSGSANGAGITIQDAVNSSTDATMNWNAAADRFDFSHKINAQGDIEGYNFYGQDYHVLNSAGNGWHEWATRSDDRVNLSVHDVSANGTITVSSGASSNITFTNSSDSNYNVELRTAYDYDGFFRVVDGGGVVRFAVGRDNHAYVGGTGSSGNKVFHDGYHPDADNADTVDNLHASQFLRSDADDTATGAINFTNSGLKLSSHFYTNRYDANGNVYFHVGTADSVANRLNIRVYDASNSYKVFHLRGDNGQISWDNNTIWHAGNDSGFLKQEGAAPSDLDSAGMGVFRINTGHSNQPASTNYGTLVGFNNNSDTGFQLASDYQGNRFYWRAGNSSNFGGSGSMSSWQRVFTDNYHPNADKWTTARTLSLTGDITGSVSWDGSQNVSMSTTLGSLGNITIGTTTDSSKITFPDKNVSDNPGAVGDKRQLISMGNSGNGGMWQTTGRGGLMLASADDSLILASGDVGRGHDPDAGGWNPDPDNEQIYLLTDSGVIFRTNLQTVSDYKQMSFDANGDLAVARNISASGSLQTAGTTRLDSVGNLTNIGSITATGNIQHTGLTMTSGTDIDQIYTAAKTLTITTSYADTGIDASDLATGTYLVQLQCNDHSVGGAYSMIYSGTMSWANNNTNDTAVDEIPLHRAGHASVGKNLFLRVQYTVSSDPNNLKLQIRGNYNASGSSTYTFKFRRMI